MTEQPKTELRLQIAHVLFLDIVGYSKLLINDQSELLEHLNEMVRGSEQVRIADAAGKLIRLTTGDGMALVFRDTLEAPANCAMELARADKEHPELQLRMGIHSGPINEITDVNDRTNITGAGVNLAQRVMDCGDAGHILLSQRAADDLAHSRHWQPLLHDVGEYEVKHGVRLHLVNLYNEEVGNPETPAKFKVAQQAAVDIGTTQRKRLSPLVIGIAGAVVLLLALAMPAITRSWLRAPANTSVTPSLTRSVLATIPEKSIAVLPFENLSSDKENSYFADGVQDEILTDLAKIADLKVISRTSVMQYKSAAARNLREIGRQLGVAHVLEGSVQRVANKVRVNTQLINARTDAHEWAEDYDRPLTDVFVIQSEIAESIASQLKAHLSASEQAAIAQPPTTDVQANDLFVRALSLNEMTNDPGAKGYLLQAISLLEEALRRDPNFLLAQCLLSDIHSNLYWFGFDHTPARLDLARAALQRAEQIDPGSGEVHLEKGRYVYHGFRDYEQARQEFELARKSLPNSSILFLSIAALDRRQAKWDDAIKNMDRAVELDPRNFIVLEEAAFTHGELLQFERTKQLLERALEISPKDYFARTALAQTPFRERADLKPLRAQLDIFLREGTEATTNAAESFVECALDERDRAAATQALTFMPAEGAVDEVNNFLVPRDWFVGVVARTFGDLKEAQRAFAAARVTAAKTVQEQPDYAPAWSLLGMIDAGLGRKTEAINEGKRACELLPVTKDSWDGPVYVNNLALIYVWVGEKDMALELLSASANRPGGLSYGVLKLDPSWDPLRGNPRFEELVASLAPK
jgi:TolB-like protein/Flp pilus assembly protein TadD